MKIINSIIKETILTFGIIIRELTIVACIVLPIPIAFVVIFVLSRPAFWDYHWNECEECNIESVETYILYPLGRTDDMKEAREMGVKLLKVREVYKNIAI